MLDTHTCLQCGNPLRRSRRGRPQRFCSDRCRKAFARDISDTGTPNAQRYPRRRVAATQPLDTVDEIRPENRHLLKSNLKFERVNEATFKVTTGELTNVPACHGWWGGYRATKALAWVINIAPDAWLARCGDQGCGPSSFQEAKANAFAMVAGTMRGDIITNPTRYLNALTADVLERTS